jgi:hypothetical protein
VLDHSAKTLYITELARGMSLLLKVMLEPKVTVRVAPTLTHPHTNPQSSSHNTHRLLTALRMTTSHPC